MKTSRAILLVGVAFFIGFATAHLALAQSANRTATQQTNNNSGIDNYVQLHEYESFIGYLEENKQTNILERFYRYSNVSIAGRTGVELGFDIHIVRAIREGRINEAVKLLDGQITSDTVAFVGAYRELPPDLRKKTSLLSLKFAKEYCDNYQVKEPNAQLQAILNNAFALLNETNR